MSEPISDDMIACWKGHYGLDQRSPRDAARSWADRYAGMAPAGAVEALGLCFQEIERLRSAAKVFEKPSAWMSAESAQRLREGGNCKGAVPVHLHRSNASRIPVYFKAPWDEAGGGDESNPDR